MSNYPSDRRYTKDHEWAKLDGKVATVGITRYAQESLGDVVYVELPKIGANVKAGEQFGVVESTKAVSELFAPLTGKVVGVNDALSSAPESINQDPHEKGWMIKVEIASADDFQKLMDADTYEKHVASQAH